MIQRRRLVLAFPTLAAAAAGWPALARAEKRAIRPPASPATSGPYSAGVLTDRLLYVSGHVGPEPGGGGFAPGDVRTQTRRCLELVGKVLAEAGLDARHVVSTTLYLADIRTLDAADQAYRDFFPGPLYPARAEIESQLLIPEALAEVSAVAVRGDWRASIYLDPDGWAKPKRPASHAVAAAGTLFFSTLRPVNPADGSLAAGASIAGQTRQLLRNRAAVLAAAGYLPGDLAATRIFLTDPRLAPAFTQASAGAPLPAAAFGIAPPLEPGHLVSMQAVAVKGAVAGRESTKAGGTVYVAGMAGKGAGIREQTRAALRSIETQLSRHGFSFADTLDAVVWLRDGRDAAAMNEVYREIVRPNPAARATVRLSPLAADALIQVTMAAHR